MRARQQSEVVVVSRILWIELEPFFNLPYAVLRIASRIEDCPKDGVNLCVIWV